MPIAGKIVRYYGVATQKVSLFRLFSIPKEWHLRYTRSPPRSSRPSTTAAASARVCATLGRDSPAPPSAASLGASSPAAPSAPGRPESRPPDRRRRRIRDHLPANRPQPPGEARVPAGPGHRARTRLDACEVAIAPPELGEPFPCPAGWGGAGGGGRGRGDGNPRRLGEPMPGGERTGLVPCRFRWVAHPVREAPARADLQRSATGAAAATCRNTRPLLQPLRPATM